MKPAAVKTSKLYSQQPHSGDGDFTATVDADGTLINKNGLIEKAKLNTPRLSYDLDADGNVSECPNLLLEPTRTNSFTYSEDFNNSYWIKENTTASNGQLSPTGSAGGKELVENTSFGRHRIRTGMFVSSYNWYSISVWAKSEDRNIVINADFLMNAKSGFNLSTGTTENTTSGTATIKPYPNGWYRCTVTGQATISHTQQFYIQMQTGTTDANYTGNGSSKVSLFGAQFESGLYATSYIPTSGTAIPRNIDYVSGAGNDALFNDSEGTLFIDVAALGNDGSYRVINISDGTTSNRVLIQLGNTNNQIRFDLISGSVLQTSLSTTSYTFTDFNKIAIKYKGNDTALFVNGTQVGSTQTGKTMPTGLDRIDFTNGNLGSTYYFTGKLKQLMYFDTALSNTELQELTTI